MLSFTFDYERASKREAISPYRHQSRSSTLSKNILMILILRIIASNIRRTRPPPMGSPSDQNQLVGLWSLHTRRVLTQRFVAKADVPNLPASSSASSSKPAASTSTAASAGHKRELSVQDFFTSIEQEQPTMFNPTTNR